MLLPIKRIEGGIQFSATIQPRSSKNGIAGIHNNTLKIRLTSPPVDGAANSTCIKFLAKMLGVSLSCITIASGLSSRNKTIQALSITGDEFLKRLEPYIVVQK